MGIGARIKQLREAANMTQTDLAKHINSTKKTVFKYETGIITNIPMDKLIIIARVLGCSPAYLLGWEENTNSGVNNGIIGNQNSNNVISVGIRASVGAEGEIENELLTLCKKMTVEQKNELLHFAYGIIKGDKK